MARFLMIPREAKFFDFFEQGAANLMVASRALFDLYEDYKEVTSKVARITDLEHQGDAITHRLMEQLHRTFITPLDREDIALLANSLDDVMDFIEGAATLMVVYRIAEPTDRARQLTAILVTVTDEVNKAILRLRHRAQMRGILEHCVEINRLENEADEVLRAALAELFDNTPQAIEVIKWREIYELLESATDRGEDIANVLEGIVLKHA